jgi:tetratricopeptide (TPR) repeat protein
MADIFVSYTSSDRDWAFWIGQQIEKLGHAAHVHEWEIAGGGDIFAWMEDHLDDASHVLCVISDAYLKAPYSALERRAAQWAAIKKRPNFALPVFVEACEAPPLFALLKRCDLHGLSAEEAQARLEGFMKPASKPTRPVPFPGAAKPATAVPKAPVLFPGGTYALSNIPIAVPRYFLGRDEDLAAIDTALKGKQGRAAIAALHGMRGVGKTTLAATYAERRRNGYRATWWIRAETESTRRADLVDLGVRLGWVAAGAPEESAVAVALDRLREEGNGILLIYDNANNAEEIRKYLPRGGAARIIVTSNAPNWGGVAAPVEIEIWPKDVGAAYLMVRTGRDGKDDTAIALSETLGGLPLAHEQAAAYCERLGITFSDYRQRFEAAPAKLLDTEKDAPAEYHDHLTVAKTFSLAIDEAAKLHAAAEPLIVYAALLAPEPIPLFLFSEAREMFGEPLASNLAGDGLDEAVAALRGFALLDREAIPDERDPAITTDSIRLHRLVREVAAVRRDDLGADARRVLIAALAEVYPGDVSDTPATWPQARRLDALAMALVAVDAPLPDSAETAAGYLLNGLALYRQGALAAYAQARPLAERALAIDEKARGPDHPGTAVSLNKLGTLLQAQGDLAGARSYYERALRIREKALGSDHPDTATSLNNLGDLLREQDDLAGAQPYCERALAIREKALGSDHLDTARSLNSLGVLLAAQGDLAGAQPYIERALMIREKGLGPDHPDTARSISNLGGLLDSLGDLAGARPYYERALAILEKGLGPDHPDTASSLSNLGGLLNSQGDLAGARPCYERALAIRERALGPDHPDTATSLNNLGGLLQAQGDFAGGRSYCNRALAIFEKVLGAAHPSTKNIAAGTAKVLAAHNCWEEAKALREKYGINDQGADGNPT